MIKKKSVFKNLFSNHTITPERLYDFGHYVLIVLTQANKNGDYTIIISELETVLEALLKENSNVDINLTAQVNDTKTVDKKMDAFIDFMKDIEPVVARAVGGRKSVAYASFYPRTVAEYDKVKKSNVFLFTGRIYKAATTHREALGEKLAGELRAFNGQYNEARGKQRRQIATVQGNRINRRTHFVKAQWTLTAAVHQAAFINRYNMKAVYSLFPFEKLYPPEKRRMFRLEGKLAGGERHLLISGVPGKEASVRVKNTGSHGDVLIWAAPAADQLQPQHAIAIQPGETRIITAADLPDLTKTCCVWIQSNSDTVDTTYKADTKGIKKEKLPSTAIQLPDEEENSQPAMVAV